MTVMKRTLSENLMEDVGVATPIYETVRLENDIIQVAGILVAIIGSMFLIAGL